jgi:polysaccharide export outer membrane protein
VITIVLGIVTSCGSSKDILYFQNTENIEKAPYQDLSNFEIRIAPNDNLLITVSTSNPIASEPYNIINLSRGSVSSTNLELQGYLVDENGNINFPEIGLVHVGGLTKLEVITSLQTILSKDIDNPVVNVRFMNYKVSVLGEVNRPGTYQINDERISIPEALAKAGDMTIYGQRHNVLVCRVENGAKKFYHIDITSPDIFFSEVYYLQQNDILYVLPNKYRAMSSSYNPMTSTYISIVSLLVGISTLIINISK